MADANYRDGSHSDGKTSVSGGIGDKLETVVSGEPRETIVGVIVATLGD
jgi:hypothetical protein